MCRPRTAPGSQRCLHAVFTRRSNAERSTAAAATPQQRSSNALETPLPYTQPSRSPAPPHAALTSLSRRLNASFTLPAHRSHTAATPLQRHPDAAECSPHAAECSPHAPPTHFALHNALTPPQRRRNAAVTPLHVALTPPSRRCRCTRCSLFPSSLLPPLRLTQRPTPPQRRRNAALTRPPSRSPRAAARRPRWGLPAVVRPLCRHANVIHKRSQSLIVLLWWLSIQRLTTGCTP